PKSSSLGLAACASFVRAKTKCACCVRGFSSKSQPSIAFVLLWSQSQPLKILWEWCGIANMAFIQLGGSSRVVEMILARVSSGFAGRKYGKTSKLYLGLVGAGKKTFWGSSNSGASFHSTYCKKELERFKLRSGKVCLVDDKTIDIASIGDVVLITSFGTSWTLKDVRYIPSLKRRLISVGQLDEEGYHVGFRDQQWKVTKGSLVVVHGNERESLYMVEVHPEGIGAIIKGSGIAAVWFGEAEESFLHNVSEDKESAETAAGVAVGAKAKMIVTDQINQDEHISNNAKKAIKG
ncbi:hypothetical protein Tco_0156568, partial [Tanacetum coccineum]